MTGMNIQVQGNMMRLDGFDFAVDEACMGLSMLSISLLMGVFIIAFQYRASKQRLKLKAMSLFFLVVFVLTIISNLMRIIALVIFKILPSNPLHEILGILCLVLYVMLPLYFLGKWMVYRFGSPLEKPIATLVLPFFVKTTLITMSIVLMAIGFAIRPRIVESEITHAEVKFNETVPQNIEGGVTKIESDDLLIYIKPIQTFFSGEHTPLICWKGSGYQFKSIRKEKIAGIEIFCGVLVKDKESLHTAWWYTDGNINTIDQFAWRTKMMKNKKRFSLVNITAKDQTELTKNLSSIFTNDQLLINAK
jgi:exosortase N